MVFQLLMILYMINEFLKLKKKAPKDHLADDEKRNKVFFVQAHMLFNLTKTAVSYSHSPR